jgi:hypothetical protein
MYPLPILLADRQVIDFRTDVLFRVLVRLVVRGVSLGLNLLNLGPQPAQHLLAAIRECGIPSIDGAGRVSTVALLIRKTPCPETGERVPRNGTRALSRLDRYTSTQGEPLDTWFLRVSAISRRDSLSRPCQQAIKARRLPSNTIRSEWT